MLYAYRPTKTGLIRQSDGDLRQARWIDLYQPQDDEIAQVAQLGISVPSLADMEEIEISSRLYISEDAFYMTAMLPGTTAQGVSLSGPVTFILTPEHLVTVRHHAPSPFTTFPDRVPHSIAGIATADRVFLGLFDEIIARLADLMENAGLVLDKTGHGVFGNRQDKGPDLLQAALEQVGQQGEIISRVRLGLLTMERVLSFYSAMHENRSESPKMKSIIKGHARDINALEVHADFLTSRVSLTLDATLGMINLQQNNTVRILSVVAALFLPPTLVASTYGMNFDAMPELHWKYGYLYALGMMAATSLMTYLILRWRKWL